MKTMEAENHLSDGDIVRALDAELSAEERALLDAHVSSCAACAQRIAGRRARSAGLSELLSDTDFDVPAATPPSAAPPVVIDLAEARARREKAPLYQRGWMRAAAVIVVALGVALSVNPVRAWIVDFARAQWQAVTGGQPALETVPVQPPLEVPRPGAHVSFAAPAGTFTIELSTPQPDAELRIGYHDAAEVTAEASAAGAELLVLPDGLRVLNESASRANYRIALPRTISTVVITIAGRPFATLDRSQLAAGQVLPLK